MEELTPIGFLDVPVLLDASQPQPRIPWLGLATLACVGILVMLFAGFAGSDSARGVVPLLLFVVAIVLFTLMRLLVRFRMQQTRADRNAVAAIMELVHLRRWPEAAVTIQQFLSKPARTLQLRTEALIYLASVLARYHRFDDAIAVHTYLLDNDLCAGGTAYGLKLGRAMAMLREDHLFDADRAINDLRRNGPPDSAGFFLLDMFRDVKTGHPDEAIRVFEDKLTVFRDQLGHRLGDAYILAARAYDLLDRKPEAADAFRKATLLEPLIELCRRYPEVQKLIGKYAPAPPPVEMA
jgi:tetratricopeptide (TPR) repeat protein